MLLTICKQLLLCAMGILNQEHQTLGTLNSGNTEPYSDISGKEEPWE